ncbi:TonB-dependent receptor family protein [Winogradskyella sp.]|nr:TonB-dependent receptor family protein [Winogradskyella sp.]
MTPLSGITQNGIISGSILNNNNQPLTSANITLINESGVVLTYAISNDTGNYKMDISSVDSSANLFLEVLYLGYKKERQQFSKTISIYNFKLTPDATLLDEVLIREKPLAERQGDTLKYNVSKFSKTEDRSIGDVLSRIPGINVSSDGKIYYNGESIENLYIHGDDLMAGKYGLASRVIRKEDIISVDVMRNHQPIKVLKDKVNSDKTSINLVLKDEDKFKLSAQAQLGAGLPEQYNVALTPILLNKKVKILNQIAVNNSGIDYRRYFKQLGDRNFISNLQSDKIAFSLSQGTVNNPDLPSEDYYINNSASINLNNLYTFKNDLKVRLNIQGLIDKNTLSYENQLTNYTANDTIVFDERQNLINKPQILQSSINVMKNHKNFFFNNNLKINVSKNDDSSRLNFNDDAFSQNLSQNEFMISNDFNYIPKLSTKGIAEIRLLTEYNIKDDKLNLRDGYQFPISQNEDYENVVQRIDIPTFYMDGYLSYKLPTSTIKQDYRLGYTRENREFNSNLLFNTANGSFIYDGDAGNALNWKKSNYYFISDFGIETKKISASLNLPIFYQSINYSQNEYNLNKTETDFFFNPNLNFQYVFSVEKRLDFSYSNNTNFGDISQVFRGVVLQNYRSLLSNNADLQRSDSDTFRLKYTLENSAELMFINGGITYRTSKTNNILSSTIEDNIIQSELLPFGNKQNNLTLDLGFSKYLFAFKTKFSLNTQLSQSTFENIINDNLVPFKSNGIVLSSNFSKSFLGIFTLDYNPRANWNFSKLESGDQSLSVESISYKMSRFEQNLNITVTPAKEWNMKLNSNYISINQNGFNSNNYFLLNLNFKHSLKNDKFELGIDVTNLFDIDEYRLYSISDNQQINSNFQLRGRMIIARLTWYL